MNSRERMLTAIAAETPDRVPLSFMIFRALQARTDGWREFIDASLKLGLDPVVDLVRTPPEVPAEHGDAAGVPVHFAPDVVTREWREPAGFAPYPVLHKEYITPSGTLTVSVNQTDDWMRGDHIPFLDDYIEPRAQKFPITRSEDLAALKHLLVPPTDETVRHCRDAWTAPRNYAAERGLLLSGGWGIAGDSAAWLLGLTNAVLAGVDQPEFLEAFLAEVEHWNRRRMEVILEEGVDLFVRRGWYEGTSFWSPKSYRRFLLPALKREVRLAHQAGAKFGYIMTVGSLQFAEMILEADVDVIIGIDDVQDHGMDLPAMKRAVAGKAGLWGGVNGFVTIEEGDDEQIRAATTAALGALGPEGFILSPVDNVRDCSDETWRKVLLFIDIWKNHAAG